AVIGNHRPPRLGDDRRMGDAGLVANALDAEDNVVGIFLQCVVNRRLEIGLRAVVVDAQAATDVHVADTGADTRQLDINPSGLGEGILDAADIGNLAAQVKVDQLKGVGHAALLQVLVGFENFGNGQAELGTEPGTIFPAASTAGG